MHEYGHVLKLRAWEGTYWFEGDSYADWSAVTQEEPHLAFKEGFANFVSRSHGSNIRCAGNFDQDDGNFAPLGDLDTGLLYPRNVTKFLCDLFDGVGGDEDGLYYPEPALYFSVLEEMLENAQNTNDKSLSVCTFVDTFRSVLSQDPVEDISQDLEDTLLRNHLLCTGE